MEPQRWQRVKQVLDEALDLAPGERGGFLASVCGGEPEVRAANAIVMAASGPVVSPFNEHPEIRSGFIDTLEEYAYGQLTAEEAAEQIIDTTNDVLAKFD